MARSKGINSNEKGARFERQICGVFSKWCSDGMRDDLFWRSASSGARATLMSRKGRKNKAQVGDISAIDPMGAPLLDTFCLECKNLGSLEIHRWVYGSGYPLANVWDKPLEEAAFQGKEPLVIAKQCRQRELVLSTERGFSLFNRAARGRLPKCAVIFRGDGAFHVWHLHDLLVRCTYARLKAAIVDSERVRL